MTTFEIVMVDGQYLAKDDTSPIFGTSPRLESYTHDGSWLDLRFSGGYEMRIPEHRVAYISISPASS